MAGLAFLPAGSASAATPVAVYIAGAASNADSGCTVTSGSSNSSLSPKNLVHGHSKGAVNLVTTWTNSGDSTDVTSVTGHYSGKTNLVRKNGAFRSATLTGSGRFNITRALGASSTCDVGVQMENAVEFITKQPTGWFYVTRDTIKGSLTETVVAPGTSLVKPVIFEVYQGGKNKVTQRAFVPKGQYVTALVAGIEGGDFPILNTKNGGSVSRGSSTNTMSAVFVNAGSPLHAAKGSATQFVRFPASVSCSHHNATLTWKAGAAQVLNGAFFANGSKKGFVASPRAGQRTVLHHLSSTADNTITAKLSLKGGGQAAATGLYVPCKG